MLELRDETPEISDYELLKTPDEATGVRGRRSAAGVWIVIAGLIVAGAIAAYIVFGRRQPLEPAATPTERVQVRQQLVQPLGANPAQVDVPPLDQTDPLVREMVKQITSHPRVAAWLATDGLVRNFVAVVANIGEGKTPSVHLRMLRPRGTFAVVQRGNDVFIDPRSYHRYDELAAAAASIDPAGASRLYATLKPRIEEAYRDLGETSTPFDRTLEHAIVLLLETPVVDAPLAARPHGATAYGFSAPDLEALTAAQKQLLRAGPDNVRTIQSSLRAIALALGIPADRLPPPRS